MFTSAAALTLSLNWGVYIYGVNSNQVVQTSLGNARVEGCVVRQVKSWHFPNSDSPTSVASYPFKFGVGG